MERNFSAPEAGHEVDDPGLRDISDPLRFLSSEQLLDSIPEAVAIADSTGRLAHLNHAWIDLMGGRSPVWQSESSEPMLQPSVSAFRTDGSPAEEQDFAIVRALQGESVDGSEIVIEFPDARRLWLRTNARPIVDSGGKIIGAIASSQDCTTLRALELEHGRDRMLLMQRVQQLERVISSMTDAVLITDAKGNTVMTNSVFADIVGREHALFSADERFPHLNMRNWRGQPIDRENSPIVRALRGEEFSSEETLIVGRNGADAYLRISGGPIRDPEEEILGGVFLIRDVTTLRAAQRERDEFVSVIAHELRTPTTLIRGFSQLLLQSLTGEEDETVRERLTIIDRRSEQLTNLITELLDISRLETGTFTFHRRPVDLDELVATVVSDMSALNNLGRLVYERREPVTVLADGTRLQQVLINLVENAVTHGPENGTVQVRLETDGENAVIHVADMGQGVPEAERERVFDRFYKVNEHNARATQGMGLGLFIGRQIVEAHGGKLWVEEAESSSFAFSLPLTPTKVGARS